MQPANPDMPRWRGILPGQRRQKQSEPRKAGAKKPAGSVIMIVSAEFFYPSVDDSVNCNNAVAEQLQMNREFLSIFFFPYIVITFTSLSNLFFSANCYVYLSSLADVGYSMYGSCFRVILT